MSANDNLKAAQAAYEGFQRDDMEPLRSILADDVEFINFEDNPFGGTFRGPGAFDHLLELMARVDLERFEIETMLADDDTVVVVLDIGYTVTATGKRSAEGPTVHIMDFRDGKMTRFRELSVPDGGAWV